MGAGACVVVVEGAGKSAATHPGVMGVAERGAGRGDAVHVVGDATGRQGRVQGGAYESEGLLDPRCKRIGIRNMHARQWIR